MIVVIILVLFIAITITFVRVVRKRKQSLRSLHQDLTTDDHPIYEKVSPIEILQWYAEAVRLGEITANEGPHQYETVNLPLSDSRFIPLAANTDSGKETDIAKHGSSDAPVRHTKTKTDVAT